MRICVECQQPFEGKTSAKYCSNCKKNINKINYRKRLKNKKCKYCQQSFQGTDKQIICVDCKQHCKIRKNLKKIEQTIVCKNCNKQIKTITKNQTSTLLVKSDSICDNCKQITSQKRRERMLGDNNPSVKKYGRKNITPKLSKKEVSELLRQRMLGDNNPMKNPETRKKVSQTLKNNSNIPVGPQNKNWKGNRPRLKTIRTRLYKTWTFPILERDNFKCQNCSSKKQLEVHHVSKKFSEILEEVLNNRVLNELNDKDFELLIQEVINVHSNVEGITYCKYCHRQFDPMRH